ncbi:MAG: hypothetical protein R3C53_16285 [Pirellulaceae bacterium]
MIDTTSIHPFAACAKFATEFLDRIAAYDLEAAEAMIDVNDSGADFASQFPNPEGFTYCPVDSIKNWVFYVVAADEDGFCCDFEVPFLEAEFRPMQARFTMRHIGKELQVCYNGLVPS